MSKFKKKRGAATPEISTASLPDIIFMLLFFFMVVTVMRESELKIKVSVPQATELEKLERKSLVSYLYVGKPTAKYQAVYGSAPRLQLGNQLSIIDDIPTFMEAERDDREEEDRGLITASLRVDRNITMGLVSDVKTELRKSGQLRINYSSTARSSKLEN
ncbi:MAG: ExbD/TolR family protein [Saprospiraceae bacterium]